MDRGSAPLRHGLVCTNYLCEDSVSNCGHNLRFREGCEFWGDTTGPSTPPRAVSASCENTSELTCLHMFTPTDAGSQLVLLVTQRGLWTLGCGGAGGSQAGGKTRLPLDKIHLFECFSYFIYNTQKNCLPACCANKWKLPHFPTRRPVFAPSTRGFGVAQHRRGSFPAFTSLPLRGASCVLPPSESRRELPGSLG